MANEIRKAYECIKCGKIFNGKGDHDRHMKRIKSCIKEELEHCNKEKRTCQFCNKQFARVETLKTHLLICKAKKLNATEDNTNITNQMLEKMKKEMEEKMAHHVLKISEVKDAEIDELKQIIATLQANQKSTKTTVKGKKSTVVNGNVNSNNTNTNNTTNNIQQKYP